MNVKFSAMMFRDNVVVPETSDRSYKRGTTSRNNKSLNTIAARA